MSQAKHLILLIDDNSPDQKLFRMGLKESKLGTRLDVSEDGDQAIAYLREREANPELPAPNLIVVDLNLPGKCGKDVLRAIKGTHRGESVPVVVLTSSRSERDISEAYALGADYYVYKPTTLDELFELVRAIEDCCVKASDVGSRNRPAEWLGRLSAPREHARAK